MSLSRGEFLLDPAVTFLNHGSFGATPRPVFQTYQDWQRRLEAQPVLFLGRELGGLLADARATLGAFVGAAPQDLVFIPNATFGLNLVARSLKLGPGDEVLASDHEYGACNHVWRFLSQKRGFQYVVRPVPLPLPAPDDLVDHLWAGVGPQTRVIFLSHISSSTAQRFPVAAVCARAREAGILSIIDGAHALGQVPLDLNRLGADFYFANGHKWLCSPKGSAFLYARRQRQPLLEPLVVSWGWGPERTYSFGSDFLDYHQILGTDDCAAYLSVPAAISFQQAHNWPTVRDWCHRLLTQALQQLAEVTGLPAPYRDPGDYGQMAISPLPALRDPGAFQAALYDDYRIEIPVTWWRDRAFLRLSIQAYNRPADVATLIGALTALMPAHRAT